MNASTPFDFSSLPRMTDEQWTELARAACAHAGLLAKQIETVCTWEQRYCANAVYSIDGEQYLKLFGPTAERQFHIERSLLRTLAQQQVIPAPRLLAGGEHGRTPPYLVLTRIPGATAEELWDGLARAEQLALARELGRLTAAIHRLPQANLAAVERQFGGRELLVQQHRARWTPRVEAAATLAPRQRDDLLRFLHEEAPAHLAALPRLAHYDMAHNHIYLARQGGGLRVSGIIDWAEAVLGAAEWDVVYLWFWTFSGDHEAMAVCLEALYADNPPPERLARRCLAALFHTSSMGLLWPGFLERGAGPGPGARELTAFLFPESLFGAAD